MVHILIMLDWQVTVFLEVNSIICIILVYRIIWNTKWPSFHLSLHELSDPWLSISEKLSLENEFVREMVRRQWVVWSLRGGLQGIPQALQTSLQHMERVEIRRETACHRLTFQEGKVKVRTMLHTLRPGMGVQIWKKLIMDADFWYLTWWKASRK